MTVRNLHNGTKSTRIPGWAKYRVRPKCLSDFIVARLAPRVRAQRHRGVDCGVLGERAGDTGFEWRRLVGDTFSLITWPSIAGYSGLTRWDSRPAERRQLAGGDRRRRQPRPQRREAVGLSLGQSSLGQYGPKRNWETQRAHAGALAV